MEKSYEIASYMLYPGTRQSIDSGETYLFLLITGGTCAALMDADEHLCTSADMLLLKPGVTQTLLAPDPSQPCALTAVRVPPETLSAYSDEMCDLAEKYRFVPYRAAIIHSEVSAVLTLRNLATRLSDLDASELRLGLSIYERGLLSVFLVLFLRACAASDQQHRVRKKKHLLIDDVVLFIREHLTEDLSLGRLEKEFFVSGEHLMKKFRASTGMSLHAYITQSRIDLSKRCILEGWPITEVYGRCGFGSYNHFFKAFKQACGMSPKAYYRQVSDIVRRV